MTALGDALRLVFWELTARCNLRCCHCRAAAQSEAAAGELTTREAIEVARAIREAGDPILILTGGEPLVRPDFFEIADACVRLFSHVALATNGTLIRDDLARAIVAHGLKRVSVSLDGATAATHDAFRGIPGSFARTLRGYDALARAGASLQVNVTLTRQNRAEIEALLDLALARRAAAFHVFALVPVGCGASLPDDARLTPEEMDAFLNGLFAASVRLRDRIHVKATCAPQYYRIMRESQAGVAGTVTRSAPVSAGVSPGRHSLHAATRGCLAGSAVCFVSRTGDVQPCGYLPLRVGNVRSQRFSEIWRAAPLFASLRDADRRGGRCGACGYRTVCGGCRARAYAASGDPLAADPDCAYSATASTRARHASPDRPA